MFFNIFKENKKSKKEQLNTNKAIGKTAENIVTSDYKMSGYDVKKTHVGSDLKVKKHNWFTGKTETKYVEVKTNNAKLSNRQKEMKRRKGNNYEVRRLQSSDNIWG